MPYCTQCGVRIDKGDVYCPGCGTRSSRGTGQSVGRRETRAPDAGGGSRSADAATPQTTGRRSLGSGSPLSERRDAWSTLGWAELFLLRHPLLLGGMLAVGVLAIAAQQEIVTIPSAFGPQVRASPAAWLFIVLYGVGLAILNAALALTAWDHFVNAARPVTELLGDGAKRLPALFGASVLASALVLVGFVLLVLPGLYLLLRLSLVVPAIVVDRQNPVAAIRASWTVSRGNLWKVLGILLAIGLANLVLSGVAVAVTGAQTTNLLLSGDVVAAVGGVAINAHLVPLTTAALTHVYLENRNADASGAEPRPTQTEAGTRQQPQHYGTAGRRSTADPRQAQVQTQHTPNQYTEQPLGDTRQRTQQTGSQNDSRR